MKSPVEKTTDQVGPAWPPLCKVLTQFPGAFVNSPNSLE